MTLANDQLTELTERINGRLAEFEMADSPLRMFDPLTRGLVRLIHDVIGNEDDAYALGYQHGYATAQRTLGYHQGDNDHRLEAEDKPLVTMSEPTPTPVATDEYPEFLNGNNGHHADPAIDDAPTLSAQAAATLGPEHVIVTPLVDAPKFDYTPKSLSRIVPRRAPSSEYIPGGVSLGNGKRTIQPSKGKRGNVLPTIDDLINQVRELAMAGVMPTTASFDLSKPPNWASATAQLQRLGLSWDDLAKQAELTPNQSTQHAHKGRSGAMKPGTLKRVRRVILVPCPNCLGSGYLATKNGDVKCPECQGSGNVERYITEIVHEDE